MADLLYCGRCGEPDDGHPDCLLALTLEPPRFCPQCRRRLVVQVLPDGWRATCSRHGETQSATTTQRP